jgi:hypothetical protein
MTTDTAIPFWVAATLTAASAFVLVFLLLWIAPAHAADARASVCIGRGVAVVAIVGIASVSATVGFLFATIMRAGGGPTMTPTMTITELAIEEARQRAAGNIAAAEALQRPKVGTGNEPGSQHTQPTGGGSIHDRKH